MSRVSFCKTNWKEEQRNGRGILPEAEDCLASGTCQKLDLALRSIIMTLNKPLTPRSVFFFICKTGVMTSALLDPEIPASLKEIMP